MKGVFGLVSLLLVLAVVGLLAKKQWSSVSTITLPSVTSPANNDAANPPGTTPGGTAQQQSMQIQQQIKAAAEAAVQQPRPMPDDK
jgi:pectate lyase